jgi:dipeptidyl aminopeptidase/acylaminoacyl peptidase
LRPAPPYLTGASRFAFITTCLALVSCSGSTVAPDLPAQGSITVRVTTWGSGSDLDGYVVVAGGEDTIPANGNVTLRKAPGPIVVALEGVAGQCVPPGPQTTTVVEDAVAEVEFLVECYGNFAYRERRDGYDDLRFLDETGRVFETTRGIAGRLYRPRWSPGGSRLAFSVDTGEDVEIHTVRPDGSGLRLLVSGPGRRHDLAWSPDGSRIAFRELIPGLGSELRVVDVETGDVRVVVGRALRPGRPTWAADGTVLAYIGQEGAYQPTLAIRRVSLIDGSDAPLLEGVVDYPVYSPDGTKIAFDNYPSVLVMDAQGGEPIDVGAGLQGVRGPAQWSDDGTQLLVHVSGGAAARVAVDGTEQVIVAPGESHDWPSDASRVVFDRGYDGLQGIQVVHSDGTGLRPIVYKTGVGFYEARFKPGTRHGSAPSR